MRQQDVVALIDGLKRAELIRWIAAGWVAPERRSGDFWFREIDIARVRLIVQVRRELRITEDDVPLVLSLLDQVYGLRHELRGLAEAVEAQPPAVRSAIAEHRRRGRGGSSG